MNQIDQIRAEIERRLNEDYCGNDIQDLTAQGVCCSLLSFLDILQERCLADAGKTLDDAAEEYAFYNFASPDYNAVDDWIGYCESVFKAGAEWDRQQGEICKVEVFGIGNTNCLVPLISFNPKSVKPGDKVIVQIRKK